MMVLRWLKFGGGRNLKTGFLGFKYCCWCTASMVGRSEYLILEVIFPTNSLGYFLSWSLFLKLVTIAAYVSGRVCWSGDSVCILRL